MKISCSLSVDNYVYKSKKLLVKPRFLLTTLWITPFSCAYLLGFRTRVGNYHPAFS